MRNTIAALVALALLYGCKGPVKEYVTVSADSDYERATRSAMKQINGFVGCNFLTYQGKEDKGKADISLRGDDGAECGTLIRIEPEEWGHAAKAYQCGERVEILIAFPGNINTQATIAAHEIGHGLGHFLGEGFEHSTIGIMSKPKDPASGEQNWLRVRDADKRLAHARYCQ